MVMLWMFWKNKTLLLLSQVNCSVLAFVSLYAFDRSFLNFAAWLFLINHVSLTYIVQLSHTISKSFKPAAFCVKCQDSRQILDISLLLLSVLLTHQTNVTTYKMFHFPWSDPCDNQIPPSCLHMNICMSCELYLYMFYFRPCGFWICFRQLMFWNDFLGAPFPYPVLPHCSSLLNSTSFSHILSPFGDLSILCHFGMLFFFFVYMKNWGYEICSSVIYKYLAFVCVGGGHHTCNLSFFHPCFLQFPLHGVVSRCLW